MAQDTVNQTLIEKIKRLPQGPGVYLWKDEHDQIVYIGKAKNLRNRVSSYIQKGRGDLKAQTIVQESVTVDYIATQTELEAMLLEAKMINSHQPKHNVIFKSGQPFLYLVVTSGAFPQLQLVRNKKRKGTYFGPFVEKTSARRVHDFLVRTFKLKVCGKKIENGCLYYHMGICSGSCRSDFDFQAYLERLELAKNALRQGHKKFLSYLADQIMQYNENLEFEKSRTLHHYLKAFENVFSWLDVNPSIAEKFARRHVWILTDDKSALFLFVERDNVLKKVRAFYFPFQPVDTIQIVLEYFLSYYRSFMPAGLIVTNFDIAPDDSGLMRGFFKQWYETDMLISITHPIEGEQAGIVRMAQIQAQALQEKKLDVPKSLKRLLMLDHEPRSIDCFDISQKQGRNMVGSCIRFVDGEPDKNSFRRFKIKTVYQQDDYAALREVVERRYRDVHDLPDLILIDGGKGQLNAVQDLFVQAEFASLAKREETVFSKRLPHGKVLDQTTYAAQVLIALRDYTHHFAISYHRKLEQQEFEEDLRGKED